MQTRVYYNMYTGTARVSIWTQP